MAESSTGDQEPRRKPDPLKRLLSVEERIVITKYRFVLVVIGGKRYLVRKSDNVPEDCTVVRTSRGGSICGI